MRYDQLPAAARAQVDAKLGRTTKPRPSRSDGAGQPCPYRCACGETFGSYMKWERHSHAEGRGHRRGEMILPVSAGT